MGQTQWKVNSQKSEGYVWFSRCDVDRFNLQDLQNLPVTPDTVAHNYLDISMHCSVW